MRVFLSLKNLACPALAFFARLGYNNSEVNAREGARS